MKRRETPYEFKEKYEDLNNAYKTALAQGNHRTQLDALAIAVNMPSKRFWVSPERLVEVINAIETNTDWRVSPRSPRHEMYEELYRRYKIYTYDHPSVSKLDACYEIVYSPAPKFYMKLSWAEKVLQRGRRQSKHERHHHLRKEEKE